VRPRGTAAAGSTGVRAGFRQSGLAFSSADDRWHHDPVGQWTAASSTRTLRARRRRTKANPGPIAAVSPGTRDPGRCISRTIKEWAGAKEATLIPSGERTSVHAAIVGNAALGMALEYDDYLLGTRTGVSAVLTMLALAEKLGSSGQDVLLAQVLANEVGGRVGLATGLGPHDDQTNSFVHLIGSAVAAGKLLQLDAHQTEHAIGLAMLQPPYLLPAGFYGSEGKTISAALIAPLGVQAAEFAANGLRGAHEAFDGERGFLRAFADAPLPGAFKGYGKVSPNRWATKIYPGCAYSAAAIDCVLNLVRQHHVVPLKVHAIYVGAGPLTLAMDARSAPYVRGPDTLATTLTHSVAYNVAVAVVDRELSPRQFTRDRIKDSAVWELAVKVRCPWTTTTAPGADAAPLRVASDDGRTRRYSIWSVDLVAFKTTFGARVRIELDGGRNFETEQEAPSGSGARPFDDRRKAVEDKFRRETRYTLRKERMEKAIDIVHHLEDSSASHIRELARLCCSEKA
jgi:2-methylcitrate dehydratase PrpD